MSNSMTNSSDGTESSFSPYHQQPSGSNADSVNTMNTANTHAITDPIQLVMPTFHGQGRGGPTHGALYAGSTRGRGSASFSGATASRGRGGFAQINHPSMSGRGRGTSGTGRGGFSSQSVAFNHNNNNNANNNDANNSNGLPAPVSQAPGNGNSSAPPGSQLPTMVLNGMVGPFPTFGAAHNGAPTGNSVGFMPGSQSMPSLTGNNIGNATPAVPSATLPVLPPAPIPLPIPVPPQLIALQNALLPLVNTAGFVTIPPTRIKAGVVCVVCGGICRTSNPDIGNTAMPSWMRPTLIKAKPEYLNWRSQSFAFRVARHQDEKELIKHLDVTSFLGGAKGMRMGSKRVSINTSDDLMHIPIHAACFEVAQRFCKDQARYDIDFRSPDGGAPSSMAHLYEIWCKRAIATCPDGVMTKPIMEPHGYFGVPQLDDEDEYLDAMRKKPSIAHYLACPVAIWQLTDIVVNTKLQTMDGKDACIRDDLVELWNRVQDLPQELYDRIVDAAEPFEADGGPSLHPARIHPSSWWKQKLLSGQLIPWLWDLDEEEIVDYRMATFYEHDPESGTVYWENGTYVFDENMWDWELLCRQLAQPDVFGPGGLLRGTSMQLWNRHRIWKLLDASRLGHVQFPVQLEKN